MKLGSHCILPLIYTVLRSTVVGVSEKLMQTSRRLVQSNLSDGTNVVICVYGFRSYSILCRVVLCHPIRLKLLISCLPSCEGVAGVHTTEK